MAHRFLSTVALVGFVSLAACASLKPAALGRLAGLDPLDMAADQVSVAAVMPVPLRLRTGDVVLHFTANVPAPHGPIDEKLLLEIVTGEKTPGVPASPSFERIQVARVAKADLARLVAAQEKVRAFAKAGGRSGGGSLAVTLSGGCRDAAISPGALIVDIYMRTKDDEKYFQVSSTDLRKLLPEDALAKLPPCADTNG